MDVFGFAEACLGAPTIDEKLALTAEASSTFHTRPIDVGDADRAVLPVTFVRFPERPIAVEPRELPRRAPSSVEGRAALLHAVAHIEFTAIQLAWDLLYRFPGLPESFYRDWLSVAGEEAQHFEMLNARLGEFGYAYGDFPVHRGLWCVAEDTAGDLAARLALVPRCMEARGLDVTPGMIERLQRVDERSGADILRRILADEVGHVAKGSRWFHWVCERDGQPSEAHYFELLQRHMRGVVRGPYNRELRAAAGFSASELDRLENESR
ncbi:MAG: ferritin-like domain-containing protein [Methylotetracoccus sp.]